MYKLIANISNKNTLSSKSDPHTSMLSSSNIKLINSLRQKKYRERENLFVIEGDKLVSEYLASGRQVKLLLAVSEWIAKKDKTLLSRAKEIITVSEKEIAKVSQLTTPQGILAVANMERYQPDLASLTEKLSIALDDVQDPGNLGTIIRLAAWFGIEHILCSRGTVDLYNPKTVQSSMGAFLHVKVSYTDLAVTFSQLSESKLPVYAATLDGEQVHKINKTQHGLLLFGNEARGITAELLPYVTQKISIPPYRKALPGIDSLNVAMSAAIICNEFRRKGGQRTKSPKTKAHSK
ncbi:MAG: RNA methyltransferase [Bacteroidales bacterium]|nr:RNA methyltransferase [Bacteroidales bacterium]